MVAMNLEQWLRHVLDKEAVRLVIQHVVNGGQGSKDIETLEVVIEEPSTWPQLMAATVKSIIETDADGMTGVQTYAIVAQNSKGENLARKTERVQGEGSSDAMSSEPANMSGIVTQLMRHSEASARLMVTSMQAILASQNRILEKTTEQNEKLIARHVETLELAEEVSSRKQEREIEIAKVEMRRNSIDQIVQQIKPLIPAIASKLLAAKGQSDSPSMAKQTFRALFESLTDKQQEQLAEILTPEQLTALTSAAASMFEDATH